MDESLLNRYLSSIYLLQNTLTPDVYFSACRHYQLNYGSWLPDDRKAAIVDLGCGPGQFLHFLESKGYLHLTGVDASGEMIDFAKRMVRARLVHANAAAFVQDATEAWDMIVLNDLLEHFDTWNGAALLKNCYRALRPGGQVIIKTPNMGALFAGASRYIDFTHQTGFTDIGIRGLLNAIGFVKIVTANELIPTGWFPPQDKMPDSANPFRRFWRYLYRTYLGLMVPIRIRFRQELLRATHAIVAFLTWRELRIFSANILVYAEKPGNQDRTLQE